MLQLLPCKFILHFFPFISANSTFEGRALKYARAKPPTGSPQVCLMEYAGLMLPVRLMGVLESLRLDFSSSSARYSGQVIFLLDVL